MVRAGSLERSPSGLVVIDIGKPRAPRGNSREMIGAST